MPRHAWQGPFGIGGGATEFEPLPASRKSMYLMGIEEGFYVSDEPGFYLEGKYGFRIESDLLVVKADTKYSWGAREYLRMRYCTPVPMCAALLDLSLLSPAEVEWIDALHAQCREEVTSALLAQAANAPSDAARETDVARSLAWLERATQPLLG